MPFRNNVFGSFTFLQVIILITCNFMPISFKSVSCAQVGYCKPMTWPQKKRLPLTAISFFLLYVSLPEALIRPQRRCVVLLNYHIPPA